MNFIAQLRAAEECGFADARRAGKKGANEEAFKFRVSVLDLSCLGIIDRHSCAGFGLAVLNWYVGFRIVVLR